MTAQNGTVGRAARAPAASTEDRVLLELDVADRSDVEIARLRALQIASGLGLAPRRQAQIATALGATLHDALAEAAPLDVRFDLAGSSLARALRVRVAGAGPRTGGPDAAAPDRWSARAGRSADGVADAVELVGGEAESESVILSFALDLVGREALGPDRVDALVGALSPAGAAAGSRERELALLGALAEAEAAVAVREEMLAIVSHDLRNPLGSIVTSAEALEYAELDGETGAFVGQMSGFVLGAARQMEKLIDDLLDLASLRSGRLAVHPAPEDAFSIVEACARAHAAMAETRGVTLVHEGSPGLAVRCDRDRMLQVLSNLVGNAVKFSDAGGRVVLGVRRERGPGGARARFTVLDTGRGMSGEEVARMFDRHWQGDGRDRRGIGLGLSIVRALVDAHGGEIDVDSEPGTGTCVRVDLPLADAAPATGRRAGDDPRRSDGAPDAARPADDRPTGLQDGR